MTKNKDIKYAANPNHTIDIRGAMDILAEMKQRAIDEAHQQSKAADPSEVGTFAYKKRELTSM